MYNNGELNLDGQLDAIENMDTRGKILKLKNMQHQAW